MAKRYFGKLMDGAIHSRGIGLRRGDAPQIVKSLQEELMRILFDAESSEEVLGFQVPKALEHARERCMEVLEGEVDWRRLVIPKRLGRPLRDYRSRLPHIIAARQLKLRGVDLGAGDLVEFLYAESENRNPYRRVVPAYHLGRGWRGYDRRKYLYLLKRAAMEILSPLNPEGIESSHPNLTRIQCSHPLTISGSMITISEVRGG